MQIMMSEDIKTAQKLWEINCLDIAIHMFTNSAKATQP